MSAFSSSRSVFSRPRRLPTAYTGMVSARRTSRKHSSRVRSASSRKIFCSPVPRSFFLRLRAAITASATAAAASAQATAAIHVLGSVDKERKFICLRSFLLHRFTGAEPVLVRGPPSRPIKFCRQRAKSVPFREIPINPLFSCIITSVSKYARIICISSGNFPKYLSISLFFLPFCLLLPARRTAPRMKSSIFYFPENAVAFLTQFWYNRQNP